MGRAMPVPTLRSATPILVGTYSRGQEGIGGTHTDVWPGSGEAHPTAGTTHVTGFHGRDSPNADHRNEESGQAQENRPSMTSRHISNPYLLRTSVGRRDQRRRFPSWR